MKTMKRIGAGLLIFTIISQGMGQAQENVDSFSSINLSAFSDQNGVLALSSTNISSISSWSDDQLTTLVNGLDATPTVSTSDLPRGGVGIACWSLQNPNWPPLPGNTIGVDAWLMSDGNLLLDDLNFDYDAISASPMRMSMMSAGGITLPGGDGGDGTNNYSPSGSPMTVIDYTTNLWIAQTGVASGYLTGIGTNTWPDVQYEIQSRTNLAQGDWQSEGLIYGSELTNWTPLSVAQNYRTNLFVRLKSNASSDGSGLPDWWESLYFGTNGVDPYANPKGDGYDNLYKYEHGMDPNVFYTPAAPQGVVASLKQPTKTATINWLPSPGAVTGYIVEKIDSCGTWGGYYPPTVTDVNVSAASTSYQDNISANSRDSDNGNNYDLSYRVKALYSGGTSSAWSATIPAPQPTVSAFVAPGANGTTFLKVSGVPANAVTVRLTFIDQITKSDGSHDPSFDSTQDIPVSAFNNGLYPLTTPWPTTDGYGGADYLVWAESVDANGDESAATFCAERLSESPQPYNWGQPFYDGRAQLKQNLIFQLRAAPLTTAFHFRLQGTNLYDPGTFGAPTGFYTFPGNYAYSGLYPFSPFTYSYDLTSLDPYLPYELNALFRNFVYSLDDVNDSGYLTTGADYSYGFTTLGRWPTYQFQTNGMPLPNLLATNGTRWLFFDANNNDLDSSVFSAGLVSVNDSDNLFTVSSGARNYFGLPYVSVNAVYQSYDSDWNSLGRVSRTVNAGGSISLTPGDYNFGIMSGNPDNIYPETAQPHFQTVKYCFYRPDFDCVPGSSWFTPTNDSPQLIPVTGATTTDDLPFLIVPAGASTQIAGYAKLAVLNGYPGVYAYLGQYLDKAYKVDGNGEVTTNVTGFVSPYGSYIPTDVGVAALVTMPDLDTGERGTCMVYSVSLQLDKNHDGSMDLSFNGADATSDASPMRFWVNNSYDFSAGPSDPFGHDASNPYQKNYNSPFVTCVRDLENYTRLWICGVPALTNGNYQVTLSWANVKSGSPAVNLVNSLETNGGTLYLTDTNVGLHYAEASRNGYGGEKYPTVSTNYALTLPANLFTNNGTKYFLFEGAGIGCGELVLTISLNSNIVCQTGAWLDLRDVNDFYEQAYATNVTSGKPPSTLVSDFKIIKTAPTAPDETKQTVVFIHGINNTVQGYENTSRTIFKRLYWSGYHGRFASFRWPCAYLPYNTANPFQFNLGEFYAFKSATAFKNYLSYLKNRSDLAGYAIDLYAHSQGNIVASEAILQGAPFDNYILTQGAIPAHCYDTNAPFLQKLLDAETNSPTAVQTPFYPANGGYHGYCSVIHGNLINLYNTSDFALATGTTIGLQTNWEEDQRTEKPEAFLGGPSYIYDPLTLITTGYYMFGSSYTVTDLQEIKALVARSRSKAVGAQGGLHGAIGGEADLLGEFGFGNTRPEHSAQFVRPIQTVKPYWDEVVRTFNPVTP